MGDGGYTGAGKANVAFSTYSIVGPIVSPYGYGAAKNRLNEICKGQVMKLFNSEAKKNLFETQYAFAENELVDDSVFADRENIPSMIGAVIGLTG